MKLRQILCGMLALAAVVGCKEELPFEPKLNVSRTAAEISADSGSTTVEVTSNSAWSAEADKEWLTITPSQGKASEEAVTVTIEGEQYDGTEDRTAVITFTAGTVEKTMKITQKGKSGGNEGDDPVTGTDSDLFVAWTSSPLMKDINRDASKPGCFHQNQENDKAEGFAECSMPSVIGNGAIRYWQADKSSFATDKVYRHVGNDGEPVTYGNWTGDYFLFEADYNLEANSNASISFEMQGKNSSLKYWRLEYLDGETWKPAGAIETLGEIEYNVECGNTNNPVIITRSVVITNPTDKVSFRLVCAGPVSIEGNTLDQPADNTYIRIGQKSPTIIMGGAITEEDMAAVLKPEFSLSETSISAEADGLENAPVSVESNMEWTATTSADWVSVTPSDGNGFVNPVEAAVKVNENDTEESRSAEITFTATYENISVTRTITVSQKGKESKPVDGTDFDLFVAWAHSADMQPINQKTFDENKKQNTAEGFGDKYVSASLGSGKITYYQVDKSAFSSIETIYRYIGKSGEPMSYGAWKGDYFLFEAESQSQIPANSNMSISFGLYGSDKTSMKYWRLEYLDGEEWKPAITTSGAGDDTYNVVSDSKATDVNASVILTQPTQKVSFRLVCASATTLDGTEQTTPVKSKWVRINPDKPIIIKGSAITDADIARVIKPAITLDQETAKAEAAGSTIALGVTSNMDWAASSDSDWATVSPAEGTASETASSVNITVAENTTSEERTATVTVTGTYGNVSIPKTFTITQAGKTEEAPSTFKLDTQWDLGSATDNFAETEGRYPDAGDHGKYIDATTGSGKLTYVQVDKTSVTGEKMYRKYGNGDVMVYGAWKDDYFLFTANSNVDIPKNTAISISFYIRGSNGTALKNWTLEYFDNGVWNTALESFEMTSKAQEVTATATFENAGQSAQFRLRCTENVTINDDKVESAPTVAARISKDKPIVIQVVE